MGLPRSGTGKSFFGRSLFQLCEEAKKEEFQVVVAAFPEILRDDYEESVSNLWRCAKADLLVAFANKDPEECPYQ